MTVHRVARRLSEGETLKDQPREGTRHDGITEKTIKKM